MSANVLREPTKRETRLGWWFMRTFRPREVARRTARNEIMAAAWVMIQRYDSWAALQTDEAGHFFAESRDRLARAIDAYEAPSTPKPRPHMKGKRACDE